MFEFDYEYGSKEMKEASNFMFGKYLTIFKIVLPILISLSYIIKYIETRDVKQLLVMALFLVFVYILLFFSSKCSTKFAINNNKNVLGMRINIQFTDSKISVKTKKENNFETSLEYEWKMICKISQNNSFYFVYLSKNRAYTIPKGSCINGNESEFVSFVQNKIKNT